MTTQADIARRILLHFILRGRHSVEGETRIEVGHVGGGRWGSQITPALDAWFNGDRSGDPLKTFSREALIDHARDDLGLRVPRHVALPVLKSQILEAEAHRRQRPKLTDLMYDPYAAAKRTGRNTREVIDEQNATVASLIDGSYGRQGLTAKVIGASAGVRGVVIRGTIHDASGAQVGHFRRTVERDDVTGQLSAHHTVLELNRDQQGTGFASAFNAHLYDLYRESGVTSVHLQANIDIGGFAWALQGFDFDDEQSALDYLDAARDKVMSASDATLTPQQKRGLLNLIGDMESGKVPLSAPTLAVYGRENGQGGKDAMWPGKWLMLGTNWDGQLFL